MKWPTMDAPKDFADFKFKAECGEMKLTQNGGSNIVVQGPGEIWQTQEGVIRFKTFISSDMYRKLDSFIRRPIVVGSPFGDEDFFTLRATDYTMPIWFSEKVFLGVRGGAVANALADGYLSELTYVSELPVAAQCDHLKLRFKEKLEFPCNQGSETKYFVNNRQRGVRWSRNIAFIENEGWEFELCHESDHTVVSVKVPNGQLSPITPTRVHEALQFVLGKELSMLVIEAVSGKRQVIRLVSPMTSRGRGRISQPLQLLLTDSGEDFWRLFVNYFQYVHKDAKSPWHPVSLHVAHVIESAAASMETEILALTIAIEGLLGYRFPQIAPVPNGFLKELDLVREALARMGLEGNTLNRIEGSLGAMRSPRNSDLLRAFIAQNRLDKRLYDSWSRLRNSSAHGSGTGNYEIATIFRLRDEVRFLFYSIVFATIDYSGPRTDFSTQNWPNVPWPVPPQPEK